MRKFDEEKKNSNIIDARDSVKKTARYFSSGY